jgi:hypothetical protein
MITWFISENAIPRVAEQSCQILLNYQKFVIRYFQRLFFKIKILGLD